MYLSQTDKLEAHQLATSFNNNNIPFTVAEILLGEYALPEYVLEINDSIHDVSLDEIKGFDFTNPSTISATQKKEEGTSVLQSALGCSKELAHKFTTDPKAAGICLRALRDKYEDISFQASRAKAEERGFFATVLYTIKKAIYWIFKTFNDLKDGAMDLLQDRPENYSQLQRDYKWLKKNKYVSS